MYHLFMYQREAFMDHYHKLSNMETAYSMIKGQFSSALLSKSDTGQICDSVLYDRLGPAISETEGG